MPGRRMGKIEIIHFSDWVKVLQDGTLIQEGHSINEYDLLITLGFNVKSRDATEEEETEARGY